MPRRLSTFESRIRRPTPGRFSSRESPASARRRHRTPARGCIHGQQSLPDDRRQQLSAKPRHRRQLLCTRGRRLFSEALDKDGRLVPAGLYVIDSLPIPPGVCAEMEQLSRTIRFPAASCGLEGSLGFDDEGARVAIHGRRNQMTTQKPGRAPQGDLRTTLPTPGPGQATTWRRARLDASFGLGSRRGQQPRRPTGRSGRRMARDAEGRARPSRESRAWRRADPSASRSARTRRAAVPARPGVRRRTWAPAWAVRRPFGDELRGRERAAVEKVERPRRMFWESRASVCTCCGGSRASQRSLRRAHLTLGWPPARRTVA